jgi:hypothetical protein
VVQVCDLVEYDGVITARIDKPKMENTIPI